MFARFGGRATLSWSLPRRSPIALCDNGETFFTAIKREHSLSRHACRRLSSASTTGGHAQSSSKQQPPFLSTFRNAPLWYRETFRCCKQDIKDLSPLVLQLAPSTKALGKPIISHRSVSHACLDLWPFLLTTTSCEHIKSPVVNGPLIKRRHRCLIHAKPLVVLCALIHHNLELSRQRSRGHCGLTRDGPWRLISGQSLTRLFKEG